MLIDTDVLLIDTISNLDLAPLGPSSLIINIGDYIKVPISVAIFTTWK